MDNYFKVNRGRLKLREGNIENALIYYEREDSRGPKKSEVILCQDPASPLKDILSKAMGVVVVDKQREIYFIDNVKFHIDTVQGLGSFIEIEAIDENCSLREARLLEQCESYIKLFQIPGEDLVSVSYCDLLLNSGGLAEYC